MKYILVILLITICFGCFDSGSERKGFQVSEITENEEGDKIVGLPIDSLSLATKPRGVLLTNDPEHRLTPIYKVNYDKRSGEPFTGSNRFHANYWSYGESNGNNWHKNFMPGFEAMYGYNLVNISHYSKETKAEKKFFTKPVLIKTLYYPTFDQDTLNGQSVNRNFYLISVYDKDTNEDGFITAKDLRRFYWFNLDASERINLIPANYSVLSSEYDPENDFMYVSARIDENQNGQMEYKEPTHIFWIDLKKPQENGILYQGE